MGLTELQQLEHVRRRELELADQLEREWYASPRPSWHPDQRQRRDLEELERRRGVS